MTKMHVEKIAFIGYSLMGCGRFEDAEDLLKGLVALDPWEPSFHVVLGSVCLAQKKLEEASSQLEEALRLHPRNVVALVDADADLVREAGRSLSVANDRHIAGRPERHLHGDRTRGGCAR